MPFIIVAGAPGAGKTTLLDELVRRGHHAVSDSAREVIAERKARRLPPRTDAVAFAREVFDRDLIKYDSATRLSGLVFFERTALESHAMLCDASHAANLEVPRLNRELSYSSPVFVVPPWREIYATDSERDHTFEHALRVHEIVMAFYRRIGYSICQLPLASPGQRADFVLSTLRNGAA
jgi:predicted ATPase